MRRYSTESTALQRRRWKTWSPGTTAQQHLATGKSTAVLAEEAAASAEHRDAGTNGASERPFVLLVVHNATERTLLKHMCQLEGCLAGTG